MVTLTDVFTARTSSEDWMQGRWRRLTVEGTRPAESETNLSPRRRGMSRPRIDSKFRLPKGASWIRSHGYPCRGGGHRDTSQLTGIRDATAGTVRASGPEAEA